MGSRTKNYRLTTAHFLKQLVTLNAADSVNLLKGLVVNPSGKRESGVSTDLFLEHLIGVTKESCSDGQSLDSMKRLTQNIDFVQHSTTQVKEGLGIATSSTHVNPDRREATIKAAKTLIVKNSLHKPLSSWTNPFVAGIKADLKLGEDEINSVEDSEAELLRPPERELPLGIDGGGEE